MAKSSALSSESMILECREKLTKIEATINGNGHDGLKSRMARIEENLDVSAEVTKENAINFNNFTIKISEDIQNLLIAVTKMEESITSHKNSLHFKDLMKKKSFYAIIVLGVFILIIVAMYAPGIFNGALVALGLPKLTLPVR